MGDGLRSTVLAGLATIVIVAWGGSASNAAEFDGLWKIHLPVSNLNECGGKPFHKYIAIVRGGTIGPYMEMTSSAIILVGRVSPGGQVVAEGRKGDDRGSATGQLGADKGNGTWKLNTRNCYGYWQAEKIGQ
jgi:hypothetical protein